MKFKKIFTIGLPIFLSSAIVASLAVTLSACSTVNSENNNGNDNNIDDNEPTNPPSTGDDGGNGEDGSNGEQDNVLPPWQPPYGDDADVSLPDYKPSQKPSFNDIYTQKRDETEALNKRLDNKNPSTNRQDSQYNGLRQSYTYNYLIKKTKSREKLSRSVDTYQTNFSTDPNFPGYPSFENNWTDWNSEFAKKLGFKEPVKGESESDQDFKQRKEKLQQQLFNARVFWRRKMLVEETVLGSNTNAKTLSNQSLPEMKPDDFNDVVYTKETPEEQEYINHDYDFVNQNWIINEIKNGTFKKHPSADYMFSSAKVEDTQNSVLKAFRVSPEWYGYFSTGLYAPAGEVITMRLDKENAEKLKNVVITISSEWNHMQFNNNKSEVGFRMPRMETEFKINDLMNDEDMQVKNDEGEIIGYEFKFGSVFGGAISFIFQSSVLNNYKRDIIFEIEDAVEHLNWVEGFTTKEEWERLVKTTKTPILTISTDTSTLYKPVFDAKNNPFILEQAKTKTPEHFAKNYSILGKTSEYISSRDIHGRRYNNGFKVNDYVPTGAAVNINGKFILSPMSWVSEILGNDPLLFTAKNNWGTFHELNHSFEWKQFGNGFQHPGEIVNNVDSMLELMILDNSGTYRSENSIAGFNGMNENNSDWQGKISPYISLIGKQESGKWVTSYDYWNAWAQYLHVVGPEVGMGLIRMLSSSFDNRKAFIDSNNPAYSIVQGNVGLETVYLMCALPGLDLTEWLEHSKFYELFTNNSDGGNVSKWNQLKLIIQQQFPKYSPFATLYSSGNYLPRKTKSKDSSSWKYLGDNYRPYQVSMFESTTFDFGKFTKFSIDVQLKEVKVVSNPKFGTTNVSEDKKSVVYTPNKGVKSNYMDDFVVEITDTKNNIYRTLIRPLLSPNVLNSQSIWYETTLNATVNINGETFIYDNGSNNKDDLRDYKLSLKPSDPEYDENKYNAKKELFINFDKYIDSLKSKEPELNNITTTYSNGVSSDTRSYNHNQISRFKTVFKPEQSGYYRAVFDGSSNTQQIVILRDIEDSESSQIIAYVDERGSNKESLIDKSQISAFLDKNKTYELEVFSTRNMGWNRPGNGQFSNLKIVRIGNDDLTNEQIEEQGLTATNLHDALSDGFTMKKFYDEIGDSIFDEIRTFVPKFYSWGLENLDFYNSNMFMNRFDRNKTASDEKIENYMDFSNSSTKFLDAQLKDGSKFVSIEQFLNTQDFKTGNLYSVSPAKTEFSVYVKLKKEISLNEIKVWLPSGKGYSRAKFIEITNSSDETKEYRINNWWTKDAFVKFDEPLVLKDSFTIKFINKKDNSDDVPQNWKNEMNQKDPTDLVISNIQFVTSNIINSDHILLPTSEGVVVDKWWQSSYLNTKLNNQKMISNVKNSTASWTIHDAESFVFYVDKGQLMGSFDVYVDDKLVGTVDTKQDNEEVSVSIFNYKFNEKGTHTIKIVVKGNGWVSIQGLGYKKEYAKSNW